MIADLLGVPEADHEEFRVVLGLRPGPVRWSDRSSMSRVGLTRSSGSTRSSSATSRTGASRRATTCSPHWPPRTTPTDPRHRVLEVARSATFLFAAGQETTAKLLAASMKVLGDHPDVQDELRKDRSRIPVFIEEALRMDARSRASSGSPGGTTTVGGIDVPAGTTVMVLPGRGQPGPGSSSIPHEFASTARTCGNTSRSAAASHSCPGGPLARVEGRVSIERILDRMADIAIDEQLHGPPGDRSYTYEPTFILRGLTELNITFTPVQ